jgi:hypothetical protein
VHESLLETIECRTRCGEVMINGQWKVLEDIPTMELMTMVL